MPTSGALKTNRSLRPNSEAGRRIGRRWRVADVQAGTLAWAAISILLVAAAILFVHETRGTTLTFDEWVWALHRRGGSLGTFLSPHNGHFSLVPIVIYKILFATAGLSDYGPYRAMVIAGHLACVLLVFVYAKRRVPPAIAVALAALLLFLGPAWQNFLWPFQIAWLISIGAGVGALLALDRHDRRGDIAACALVACSLASSGIGLAVAIGVTVDILARRDRRRRAWIVYGPLAVYAVWWVTYQNTSLTLHAIEHAPGFVATAASATLAALTGLSGSTVPFGTGTMLEFGPPLVIAAVLGLGWHLRHAGNLTPRVLALLAITGSFWLLAAVGRTGVAQGYSSRYLYVGAVFILLLGAELLRGRSLSAPVMVIALVIVLAVLVVNVGLFSDAGSYERTEAQLVRTDLGALDIGRPAIAPGYVAADFPGFGVVVAARPYFAAERAIGTPAASPQEIESYPDGVRREADAELIAIHRVRLTPAVAAAASAIVPRVDAVLGGVVKRSRSCLAFSPAAVLSPAGAHELQLTLPAGGMRIRARGGPAAVAVRRFSTSFQTVGSVASGGSADLAIAADLATAAWHVRVAPSSGVTVCGLRSVGSG